VARAIKKNVVDINVTRVTDTFGSDTSRVTGWHFAGGLGAGLQLPELPTIVPVTADKDSFHV
jgi:hypothetical protein